MNLTIKYKVINTKSGYSATTFPSQTRPYSITILHPTLYPDLTQTHQSWVQGCYHTITAHLTSTNRNIFHKIPTFDKPPPCSGCRFDAIIFYCHIYYITHSYLHSINNSWSSMSLK